MISVEIAVGKLKEVGNRMKGDVKVVVNGCSGHIVISKSSLIKQLFSLIRIEADTDMIRDIFEIERFWKK